NNLKRLEVRSVAQHAKTKCLRIPDTADPAPNCHRPVTIILSVLKYLPNCCQFHTKKLLQSCNQYEHYNTGNQKRKYITQKFPAYPPPYPGLSDAGLWGNIPALPLLFCGKTFLRFPVHEENMPYTAAAAFYVWNEAA